MAYFKFDKVCTLFCHGEIDALKEYFSRPAEPLQVSLGKLAKRIVVRDRAAVLTLHRSQFVGAGFSGPGREFNRTIVGAGNFFRNVRAKKEIRQRVLDHIYATTTILGCVAEPAFSKAHHAFVFGLARAMNGLVFDGQGMLDGHGMLVLDKLGHSAQRVFSQRTPGVRTNSDDE